MEYGENTNPTEMPFGRKNYILLIAGILAVVTGMFLMSGEPYIDATEFSIALHVSPVIIIAGYSLVIYSILAKK